ncbi:MAG: AMP-binding protein [Planctomycetota bacterium]
MSILRKIMQKAVTHPAKVAVIDDQREYTFFKIAAGALFAAKAIEQATQKDKIGIMLPTSGAFTIAFLGTWLAKKTPVPLNYLLSQDELAHVVADSGIDTIITAEKMIEAITGLGIDVHALPGGVNLMKLEEVSFKGLPPLRMPPKLADDDLAVLLYTSGTSGKPKGVMLTEKNIRTNIEDSMEHAGLSKCDTFLGVLPQFHTFGLTVLTLLPLFGGGRVVYTARFNPRKIMDLMRKHRPQLFIGVPSMLGALLNVKSGSADDWKSLRYVICGGEPLPQAVYDGFKDKLGVEINEGYGLTETSPVTNWSTPENTRLHSVGLPLPNVQNFIVDDNDNLLGRDEEGEILISAPSVMQGYYQLPELTDKVILNLDVPNDPNIGSSGIRAKRGGSTRCFRTGDIGKIDKDGYLYITGRKKEMLIIGGENVFPREIEEVLNRHETVNASAVIGRADDTRGEVAIAFVELAEGAEFDEGALKTYCRDNMASFKVPKEIRVLDELPRNPTGKILRRALSAD